MNNNQTPIISVNEKEGIVKYTVKAYGKYFTGKSKTNFDEGDTFDKDKGIRIAKYRALLKMKKYILTEFLSQQAFIRELASFEEIITEHIRKITESSYNIQNKLDNELK